MRVDMISAEIANPLQVVSNMMSTAKESGAAVLRIEGTLANPRLLDILTRRYGLVSDGATEAVMIPLR